tara:strand:+ start:169 stop:783 length:615 start_codon:yes stop_codon:yes gene_type:complete
MKISVLSIIIFNMHSFVSADPISSLESFVDLNQSASVRFIQTVYDSKGDQIETTNGVLYFKKPGKFKWHYQEPFEQLIICNGRTLWVYDRDLEQVIIRSAKDLFESSPAALLAGSDQIDSYYLMNSLNSTDDGVEWLILTPLEDDGTFESIKIGFSDGEMLEMELIDYLQQKTVIGFSKFNNRVIFESSAFEFSIPKNAEVLAE